jgi:hypothetical protein
MIDRAREAIPTPEQQSASDFNKRLLEEAQKRREKYNH